MNVKLKIDGMHCKSCKMLIEDSVSELSGVESIEVNADKKEAVVVFDESVVTLDAIKKTIEADGYTVK